MPDGLQVLQLFPRVKTVTDLMLSISRNFHLTFRHLLINVKSFLRPKHLLLWLYLLINAVMNMFAAMRMTTLGTPGSVLVYAGSVFFFLSDCALFLLLYLDDPKIVFKRNFTIMITYLAAEFLIVTGVLMG